MYFNGQGVPQDYAEAMKWVRKAADQGLAIAQSKLGNMYAAGQGVSQDYAEAAKWYRKAADQGIAPAQGILGAMYFKGQGVPQDRIMIGMSDPSQTGAPRLLRAFERLRMRLTDGAEVSREVERHGDAVAVLPYDVERRSALVVRLLRASVLVASGEEMSEEACAGMIENEDGRLVAAPGAVATEKDPQMSHSKTPRKTKFAPHHFGFA